MGILWRFTLRSLKANRTRTIVSIVGVMLSCALVTGIFSTVTSMEHALLKRTIDLGGTWQIFSASETDDTVAEIVQDPHSVNVMTERLLGFAKKDDANGASYTAIVSAPTLQKGEKSMTIQGVTDDICRWPEAAEGRRPQDASEVMVPQSYLNANGLALNGTVTLNVGQRLVAFDGETHMSTPSESYLSNEGVSFVESAPRSFTVVGTFNDADVRRFDNAMAFSGPAPIFCGPATSADGGYTLGIYVTTNLASYDDIGSWCDRICQRNVNVPGMDNVTTGFGGTVNNELLIYQGVTPGRRIYDSLWMMAAILAAVIAAVSISLVYNAFAISVADRTRQFGLLRGIGASRAQIRLTVFCEALLVGIPGIVLGIAAGIVGTATTLQITAKGFASALRSARYEFNGIELWTVPEALGICAAIVLVVLLVSAMVPALRASHASAVDAIRQSGLSGRARRGKDLRPGSGRLARRLFGTPGLIAHRSLTRKGSRGRVVVASLAVSCMLVITCGLISNLLNETLLRSGRQMTADADVTLSFTGSHTSSGGDGFVANVADTLDVIGKTTDAEELSRAMSGRATAIIPADLLAAGTRNDAASSGLDSGDQIPLSTGDVELNKSPHFSSFTSSGDYAGSITIDYLAGSAWKQLVRKLGLSEADFCDPAHPRAIAVNNIPGNGGQRYVTRSVFGKTGDIDVLSDNLEAGTGELEGYSSRGVLCENGVVAVRYVKSKDENSATLRDVIIDGANPLRAKLTVGALADASQIDLSGSVNTNGFCLLLLPDSLVSDNSGVWTARWASVFFRAQDHAQVTRDIGDIVSGKTAWSTTSGSATVVDSAAERESGVSIVAMMNLFVAIFSVMTMLIALANVFNTLTNSIILRTREFATLKSAGMGQRAFGRMLAYECASYALRGLAIGFVLAAIVAVALQGALNIAVNDAVIAVPWAHVLVAIVGALVVLAASTVFAVRRTSAQNTVEALRKDSL